MKFATRILPRTHRFVDPQISVSISTLHPIINFILCDVSFQSFCFLVSCFFFCCYCNSSHYHLAKFSFTLLAHFCSHSFQFFNWRFFKSMPIFFVFFFVFRLPNASFILGFHLLLLFGCLVEFCQSNLNRYQPHTYDMCQQNIRQQMNYGMGKCAHKFKIQSLFFSIFFFLGFIFLLIFFFLLLSNITTNIFNFFLSRFLKHLRSNHCPYVFILYCIYLFTRLWLNQNCSQSVYYVTFQTE